MFFLLSCQQDWKMLLMCNVPSWASLPDLSPADELLHIMNLVFFLTNSFDLKHWAEIPQKWVLFSAIQSSCDFPQPHSPPGLSFSIWELNHHFNNLLFAPFPRTLHALSLWFFFSYSSFCWKMYLKDDIQMSEMLFCCRWCNLRSVKF